MLFRKNLGEHLPTKQEAKEGLQDGVFLGVVMLALVIVASIWGSVL